MKRFAILLVAIACATFAGTENADAQQSRQVSRQSVAQVVVPPSKNRPKLGINGFMVPSGNRMGYKLTYVAPGSVAQRMGLERGDVIRRINDIHPLSQQEVITALNEAASYYGGKLSMEVENIRWHLGQSNQRYVGLKGNLYR